MLSIIISTLPHRSLHTHTNAHTHPHTYANTLKHTKLCGMLLLDKLSPGFTAVIRFPIFSLWSVTVQMMIIRELFSHFITSIPCQMCVAVFVCVFWMSVCFHSCSDTCLKINVNAFLSLNVTLIRFEWPVKAAVFTFWLTCWNWWIICEAFKHLFSLFNWQQRQTQCSIFGQDVFIYLMLIHFYLNLIHKRRTYNWFFLANKLLFHVMSMPIYLHWKDWFEDHKSVIPNMVELLYS